MRALIAGWFSFRDGTATGGDLLAAEVVCSWLSQAKIPYDIAVAPPFVGGVVFDDVNPAGYTHAIFVCGPFGSTPIEIEFLETPLSSTFLSVPADRDQCLDAALTRSVESF